MKPVLQAEFAGAFLYAIFQSVVITKLFFNAHSKSYDNLVSRHTQQDTHTHVRRTHTQRGKREKERGHTAMTTCMRTRCRAGQ